MSLFRRNKPKPEPVWVLGVDSVPWIDDYEAVIDGVLVKFTKPGWSWTVLREDLSYGGGRIADIGPAQTQEDALRIGLEKMKEHQEAFETDGH